MPLGELPYVGPVVIVLGIFAFGMNPGACLVRDGELVAFGEEERFTRLKGSHGMFPGGAVNFCLRQAEIEMGDVDRIAFAWDANKYPYRMLGTLAKQYLKYRSKITRSNKTGDANLHTVLMNLLKFSPKRLLEEIRVSLRALGVRGEIPPIEFVPHHLCHSYTAYFCSPFDDAVVLTLDGSGEETCTQVAVGRGTQLKVESSIPIPHSLGWYYAAFTAYMGFTPYHHEGKLMGLAGLGQERGMDNPWPERLDKVLSIGGGRYEVDPTFTRFGQHTFAERFTDTLASFITGFDPQLQPLTCANGVRAQRCLEPGYVDLAWGVQARLEAAALEVARQAARTYETKNLCVAGGVGLNCKMNGALLDGAGFDNIFVFPACNDAGAAIGAALVVAKENGDPIKREMQHAYFGPEYSADEIREAFRFCKLTPTECTDICERVAAELAQGKLVGWFQGRMELGPRALGARSILADPRTPDVTTKLNREVKSREVWRPFCPSILEGAEDRYFQGARDASFMTLAVPVRPELQEPMRPAMHVDGSARPQVVRPTANPRFHDLLQCFERETGLPYLINTSFNVADEPIVCTPKQAISSFYSSGLDILAIGDFVLEKT